MDREKFNASGCRDMTAYNAIKNIEREKVLRKLINDIFQLCEKAGFHLEERLVLKDKKTGKIWR